MSSTVKTDVKISAFSLKDPQGTFLVFETTHLTMKAEKILKAEGIPFRLFPKPRSVISECGIIVKVLEENLARASQVCKDKGLTIKDILSIK